MLQPILQVVERLTQTLWVGAIWGIGYLAVPVLFATLDDRQLAGALAGQMFSLMNIVGLVCGAILMALAFVLARPVSRTRVISIAVMVLVVVVLTFVLQPMMQELKASGLAAGGEAAARFGQLHGISSGLYLLMSVAGLVLVALPSSTRQRQNLFS